MTTSTFILKNCSVIW